MENKEETEAGLITLSPGQKVEQQARGATLTKSKIKHSNIR